MGGGVPGMTTWFYRGVGQMTMFDHEGGRGVKISRKSDHVVYGCPLTIIQPIEVNVTESNLDSSTVTTFNVF